MLNMMKSIIFLEELVKKITFILIYHTFIVHAPAPPALFPTYASAHPDQVSEVIVRANEMSQT